MTGVRPSQTLRTIPMLLIMAALGPLAHGKVIYVDDDAAGANDGTSWANAYVYLQDALADANDSPKPVQIRVAEGIYKPDQGANETLGDREATFQLINGVSLIGGFAGLGEPEPNDVDWDSHDTRLSGTIGTPFRKCIVFSAATIDNTAVLKGFTVTQGSRGMANRGSPAVANCRFIDGGQGMDNYLGSPVLTNCTFAGNQAECGGGMSNHLSSPILTNCAFIGNHASAGGGMFNTNGANPTLIDCTFIENTADHGGGIQDSGSWNMTLINCTFFGNSARTWGGGIDSTGSRRMTLSKCTFVSNRAEDGAGIAHWRRPLSLSDCAFGGNSASSRGGGLYTSNGDVTLMNCIFTGNLASSVGAGLYAAHSKLTLVNCTSSGNSAEAGDALACDSTGFASPSPSNCALANCIFRDGAYQIWNNDGSMITVIYSNVEGGQAPILDPCETLIWGQGNIDADPLFEAPGYWDANDTPDDPNDDFWVDGDYHLKSQSGRWDPTSESWVFDDVTSPCIDAGDPNSPVAFEPSPNGAMVNMGAYGGTAEASKSPSGLHAPYGGGTGEPNNPYLIYTAEHLNALGAEPNDYDKHFKLMADIDLSGHSYDRAVIAPHTGGDAGDFQGTPFTGSFEGNAHAIKNLVAFDHSYLALFGSLGEGATILNLRLLDVDIKTGGRGVAPLAGCNYGAITNCQTSGRVGHGVDACGLVGRNYGTISSSSSECAVVGIWGAGGLVGWNVGLISDCSTRGSVEGAAEVGGIAGTNGYKDVPPEHQRAIISNCHSVGPVSGNSWVGGLVGWNEGRISQCSATGPVSGRDHVGGLVGLNRRTGEISQCCAKAPVAIETNKGGGLVGESDLGANISHSYATGPVEGCHSLGGLVGLLNAGAVTACYAVGTVRSTCESVHYIGGLIGVNTIATAPGVITTSFWDIQTTGQTSSYGGVGLATAEMQTASTFLGAGWDFVDETQNGTDDIWWILEGQDYPRLWWERGDETP